MNKLRKLLVLLLVVSLTFAFSACKKDEKESKKSKGGKTGKASYSDTVSDDGDEYDDFDETDSDSNGSASNKNPSGKKTDKTSPTGKSDTGNQKKSGRTGITYYVSADGTDGEGTDINRPMSLETANGKLYKENDKIFLKRGDTFYGCVNFHTAAEDCSKEERIYVGAYGKGKNPVITAAKIISNPSSFVKQGDFYVADLTDSTKYTGYITAPNDKSAVNIGFFADENNNIFPSAKPIIDDCVNEYDYYCNDGKIYIKTKTNPIEKLGTLYFASYAIALVSMNSNTEFSDLTVRMCGGHGMRSENNQTDISNLYIHDIVIECIGGSLQYEGQTSDEYMIRLGNGIEFYNNNVEDVLIENCIIRKCYDVAFTMQGNAGYYQNVTVRNCVMYQNKQSSEIFNEGNSLGVVGYEFCNNICINSGNGCWGYEAFNYKTGVPCEFLFYNYFPEDIDIKLHHNIIFNPIRLYWWAGTDNYKPFNEGVFSYENSLYLGKIPLLNSALKGEMGILRETYNKEILSKQHSLIGVDMSEYEPMFHAAEFSYDINEIRNTVKKCGVAL